MAGMMRPFAVVALVGLRVYYWYGGNVMGRLQFFFSKLKGLGAWILPAVILLVVGVAFFWRALHTQSLLPSAVVHQVKGFQPYFYAGTIPANYQLDKAHTTYSNGILFVQLTKKDSPPITITEQRLPTNLSTPTIQQNGEAVKDTVGEATINDVEGRLVGTMISPDQKTLVLLASRVDATKVDLTLLLQGLRAAEK